jgi:hypothetical protein
VGVSEQTPNIIRVIKIKKNGLVGACGTLGERRCAYRVFVENPKGKRQLEKPRRKWEVNNEMGLQKLGF